MSAHEFDSIGEDMKKPVKQRFGDDGFEEMVAHAADLEKAVGIAEPKQFTLA